MLELFCEVEMNKKEKNLMLQTVEGNYNNGQIRLTEVPTGIKSAKVIVTFVEVTNGNENVKETSKSIFELGSDLFGKYDSGLGDLATNKKHLEGLGRD